MKIENRNREKQIAFGGYPCRVSHRLSLYVNVAVDFQYLVAPFCCLLYPFVCMVLLSNSNIHPHTLPSNDYVVLLAARLLALLLLSFLFSFHSRIQVTVIFTDKYLLENILFSSFSFPILS